jgi:hypothetical protein
MKLFMLWPMRRDFISVPRQLTVLLFFPQVIYEHGEPRWNDIDRRKLILQPQLSGNSTSSHLVEKQEEHGEGTVEFCLRNVSFIIVGFFNMS